MYDDKRAWKDAEAMGMTFYYMFLLKKGPTWSPESTPEVSAVQEAHLANMKRLTDDGKLVINGPLLDSFATSDEIRGIGALKATSMDEARELIGTDPMVKAGRLIFELHTWMIGKNILL